MAVACPLHDHEENMKINGITVSQPKPEVMVLPFGGAELVIHARYIPAEELEELDKLLIKPEAPVITRVKDGKKQAPAPDTADKAYQSAMDLYHQKRMSWVYIRSLDATEGIEWDTVKIEDPETWNNWTTDLESSGLPNSYIIRISQLVSDAQGWNPERIEEATKNFLALAQVE